MGMFWEILQELQIRGRVKDSLTLEKRVELLEEELQKTQEILAVTLEKLEEATNQDISGNGQVGKV